MCSLSILQCWVIAGSRRGRPLILYIKPSCNLKSSALVTGYLTDETDKITCVGIRWRIYPSGKLRVAITISLSLWPAIPRPSQISRLQSAPVARCSRCCWSCSGLWAEYPRRSRRPVPPRPGSCTSVPAAVAAACAAAQRRPSPTHVAQHGSSVSCCGLLHALPRIWCHRPCPHRRCASCSSWHSCRSHRRTGKDSTWRGHCDNCRRNCDASQHVPHRLRSSAHGVHDSTGFLNVHAIVDPHQLHHCRSGPPTAICASGSALWTASRDWCPCAAAWYHRWETRSTEWTSAHRAPPRTHSAARVSAVMWTPCTCGTPLGWGGRRGID